MDNPYVRLLIRAIISGVSAAVTAYAVDPGNYGSMLVAFLGAAALLAGTELGTPVNKLVGPGKDAELVDAH